MNLYESDPKMKEYFESLPMAVRMELVESGVEISTLGELKQAAEHLMER